MPGNSMIGLLPESFMYKALSFLSCFLFSALSAATIANVEFQFPGSMQEWEVINEMKEEEMTGVLYSRLSDDGAEYFGVNSDHFSPDLPDAASLKEGLSFAYPDNQVEVSILEKTSGSVLYEWSICDEAQPLILGWGRVISTDKGNAALTYITGQVDQIESLRPLWLKALKEAKLLR